MVKYFVSKSVIYFSDFRNLAHAGAVSLLEREGLAIAGRSSEKYVWHLVLEFTQTNQLLS
jgi:hypothetical protein